MSEQLLIASMRRQVHFSDLQRTAYSLARCKARSVFNG
jgi:hypothetical protein